MTTLMVDEARIVRSGVAPPPPFCFGFALFMLLAPTLMEGSITAGRAYRAFDVLYVAIMIAGTGWIAWEVQGQVTLTKNRTYKTRSHDSER